MITLFHQSSVIYEYPTYDPKLHMIVRLRSWSSGESGLHLQLLLLPGPLWPGVLVPVRVQSMGHIEILIHLRHLKPFNGEQKNESQ